CISLVNSFWMQTHGSPQRLIYVLRNQALIYVLRNKTTRSNLLIRVRSGVRKSWTIPTICNDLSMRSNTPSPALSQNSDRAASVGTGCGLCFLSSRGLEEP